MSTSTTNSGSNERVQELKSQASEAIHHGAESLAATAKVATEHYVREPARDVFSLAKAYAKDKPEVAAAWAFGLGFMIGWKCKPW